MVQVHRLPNGARRELLTLPTLGSWNRPWHKTSANATSQSRSNFTSVASTGGEATLEDVRQKLADERDPKEERHLKC